MQSLRIIVHGLVQGVYYRQSTIEKAKSLHLAGTVRNCSDGNVEIIAEGTKENLDKLIAWCHEGPPGARVTHLDISEMQVQKLSGFTITR